jgi:hypothetical protein
MRIPVTMLGMIVLSLLGAQVVAATPEPVATDSSLPVVPTQGRVVVAYYFYTTLRCENCLRIEAWSKEALDSAFSEQQSAGLLWWRPLNTDLPRYSHFTTHYNLERKSLVIAEFRDGQQVRWKKCENVWDLLDEKLAFIAMFKLRSASTCLPEHEARPLVSVLYRCSIACRALFS